MGNEQHNLASRLTEVRTLANQSQSELARKMDISPSLISFWEKGTRTPSESQLLDLSRHLGVALDYLLNAEVRPHFKCRVQPTSPHRDEIHQTLLDASMQIHFVDTAYKLAQKTPAALSVGLRLDFESFENLPSTAAFLRDTLKLNRRVTLDELKQALSEWNIFVFDWEMPWHLSGLSYRGPFTAIFINHQHSPARRLFTLAHEFAHVVFHLDRKEANSKDRRDTVVSLASHRDPLEKQANAFAGEFLVPRADLKSLVEKYGDQLRSPAMLEAAARHFNVSRDAIFYRLTQLNFFHWSEKAEYFKGKYDLVEAPPSRVKSAKELDQQVDGKFRDLAMALHQAGEISTGKLAEWFFTPRHELDNYLAGFADAEVMGISDGANHEGDCEGAD